MNASQPASHPQNSEAAEQFGMPSWFLGAEARERIAGHPGRTEDRAGQDWARLKSSAA